MICDTMLIVGFLLFLVSMTAALIVFVLAFVLLFFGISRFSNRRFVYTWLCRITPVFSVGWVLILVGRILKGIISDPE